MSSLGDEEIDLTTNRHDILYVCQFFLYLLFAVPMLIPYLDPNGQDFQMSCFWATLSISFWIRATAPKPWAGTSIFRWFSQPGSN